MIITMQINPSRLSMTLSDLPTVWLEQTQQKTEDRGLPSHGVDAPGQVCVFIPREPVLESIDESWRED